MSGTLGVGRESEVSMWRLDTSGGGLRVGAIPASLIGNLREFCPTHVIVLTGGNDISSRSRPAYIVQGLISFVNFLRGQGLDNVYVGGITRLITEGD